MTLKEFNNYSYEVKLKELEQEYIKRKHSKNQMSDTELLDRIHELEIECFGVK